ncbi:HNH endonuclease signature motif containing protein [Leuconostoc falkenbergense]|uniref:HNH endonuclease signature motif containing protein n=1 Tax=Leuconostoc falkenbergense TaxID=2766470 RepID=UPI003F9654D2
MRLHRCAEVGCRELIKVGYDYCDKHYSKRLADYHVKREQTQALASRTLRGQQHVLERNRDYDSSKRQELGHEFYHSKQWTKISQYVKQRDMYVDAIDGRAYDTGDLIVDHIVPRRLLKTKTEQYNMDNLWLLTKVRHNHKTAIENKLSDNKLRHLSREWWLKVLKD